MKETILDVLMFMFQSYVEDNEEVELDKKSLHKNLSEAGFADHNIEKAFEWLEGLPGVDESAALLNKPTKDSFRLFSDIEQRKIGEEVSMKEIELKILNINVKEVKEKLKELQAQKVFDGNVHATHLDSKDYRLRKEGKDLRVRTVGDKIEFCFKGPNESSKFKTKEEIEVNTSSLQDTIKILNKLGFEAWGEFKKHRESYKIGNVRFEIDTYPELPTFLEIEAPPIFIFSHCASFISSQAFFLV